MSECLEAIQAHICQSYVAQQYQVLMDNRQRKCTLQMIPSLSKMIVHTNLNWCEVYTIYMTYTVRNSVYLRTHFDRISTKFPQIKNRPVIISAVRRELILRLAIVHVSVLRV